MIYSIDNEIVEIFEKVRNVRQRTSFCTQVDREGGR
jgi:hypothetical protein